MVILLVGSSGLLGTALRKSLAHREVRQLVRRPAHPSDPVATYQWDAKTPPPTAAFEGVSAVINLGGAGVGDRRWSKTRLKLIKESRTEPTRVLAETVAALPQPVRYLQASAVGVYGDTGSNAANESTPPGSTPLAEICTAWEAAAYPAVSAGQTTSFLRTGIVLSSAGGALAPLLRLIKLGLGGPLGNGNQWWPWIHVNDWVNAIHYLLDHDLPGPINLVAPTPRTNREITKEVAAAFRRPALLPAPAFALRLILGGFADEILRNQKVVPEALIQAGFNFDYPDIVEAAQALTAATRH